MQYLAKLKAILSRLWVTFLYWLEGFGSKTPEAPARSPMEDIDPIELKRAEMELSANIFDKKVDRLIKEIPKKAESFEKDQRDFMAFIQGQRSEVESALRAIDWAAVVKGYKLDTLLWVEDKGSNMNMSMEIGAAIRGAAKRELSIRYGSSSAPPTNGMGDDGMPLG